MVGEDNNDNLIKEHGIVSKEWDPDFYRDFQLSEEEDFVVVRCPSWFMQEIEEITEFSVQDNFEGQISGEEAIRVELLKSLNLPEDLTKKMIDQIEKETTVKAVKAGEDWGMFLAKLKILPYLYESFFQALIDLKAKNDGQGKSIKIESLKIAQRFSVISDLRNKGKMKFEVLNDS